MDVSGQAEGGETFFFLLLFSSSFFTVLRFDFLNIKKEKKKRGLLGGGCLVGRGSELVDDGKRSDALDVF